MNNKFENSTTRKIVLIDGETFKHKEHFNVGFYMEAFNDNTMDLVLIGLNPHSVIDNVIIRVDQQSFKISDGLDKMIQRNTPEFQAFVDPSVNELYIVRRDIGKWVLRLIPSENGSEIHLRNFKTIRNGQIVNLSEFESRD